MASTMDNGPLRVAHFLQRYPPALGGSEAYFARLSRFLAAGGDHVSVFTSNALALEAFWKPGAATCSAGVAEEDGVEVRRYGLLRWPGRRWLLKPLSLVPHRWWQCLTLPCNPIAPRMWSDARKLEPAFDVVHAAAFPYAFPIACGLRLARRQKIPFLVTPFLHSGDPIDAADPTRRAYTQPALLFLLRAADAIFVQTDSERHLLLSAGLPAERLVLQGMGVDAADCTGGDRERARTGWGLKAGELAVGHLANNSHEKGTIDLLLAAQRLWQRGNSFHVVLAGPEMPNFRRFWNDFQPLGPVHRLGILDDSQKRDFFAGLDVFALPSRSDSFGLVLLEAWANGLPNIAYRAGGVADVLRHQEDGLLVRCGDVQEFAAQLERLLTDAALRVRLGRAGLDRVAHEFRWHDKLELVRQVYREKISDRRSLGLAAPLNAGR